MQKKDDHSIVSSEFWELCEKKQPKENLNKKNIVVAKKHKNNSNSNWNKKNTKNCMRNKKNR